MLSRRKFLGIAGGAAVGGAVGARLAWGPLVGEHVPDPATAAPGTVPGTTASGIVADPYARRVLVVVQMGGGNDGLNTLVPVGDGHYFDSRPTLHIAEDQVLHLAGNDHYGFHPALAPLVPHWEQGRLAALESIGFPGQTRSHFTAMDAWWSARPNEELKIGWLGRWLDATATDPNPLRAIALGGGSPALIGANTISTLILDPATFALRTSPGVDRQAIVDAFLATASPLATDPMLAAAQRSVPASIDALELLAKASAPADDPNTPDDEGLAPPDKKTGEAASLTELLQTAAGIIELNLGTRIILVAAGGFDTHSAQDTRHPVLLADLAGGIAGFLDSVARSGRADDVLLVTTSEFGRRVEENGSGTDHGKGSVQLVIGPTVKGKQVVGSADLVALDDGDLSSNVDSRSLYSLGLDWLSGPTGPTDAVLGGSFDRYGLLG